MTGNPNHLQSIDIFNLPPDEYYGLVLSINQNSLAAYRSNLRHLPLFNGQAIVVNGSDGKFERHTQSRSEFVVLEWHPTFTDLTPDIRRTLKGTFMHHCETAPNGKFEVQVLDDYPPRPPLSFAYDNSQLVYPDRLLNIQLICGNQSTMIAARRKVIEEMCLPDRLGGKIREHMKTQSRRSRQAIRSGKSRGVVNFDRNFQYYQEGAPGELSRLGFKPAFLRAVQRRLDLYTVQAVQVGSVTPQELSQNLPTPTLERINYFTGLGLIRPDAATQTAQAYAWFLQRFHEVQDRFKRTRQPVTLPYNPDAFRRHSQAILNFTWLKYD